MNKKWWISATLIVMWMFMPWHVEAANFKDVPKQSPYYEGIDYLTERSIISGHPDGTFRPNAYVTRGEAAKMIASTLEHHRYPLQVQQSSALYYKDLSLNTWYYPYVVKLNAIGAMQGYRDNTFRLKDSIQRDQFAKVVATAFQLDPVYGDRYFSDLTPSHWSYPFIQTLATKGMIQKPKNSQYQASHRITRGEVADILYRAVRWEERNAHTWQGEQNPALPNLYSLQRKQEQQAAYKRYVKPVPKQKLAVQPKLTLPYRPGQLSEAYTQHSLQAIYYVRAVAGLTNTLKVTTPYMEEAQAAAFVLALNNTGLSHEPVKPPHLSSSFYEKAYNGASTSNIAYGYHDIASSIYYGYMMDSDPINRKDVGHRRWLICPCLSTVGFGEAKTDTIFDEERTYNAIKLFDHYVVPPVNRDVKHVTWPAEGAFPMDLFVPNQVHEALPWSVGLSPEFYRTPQRSQVVVQLKRVRDGKQWTFSANRSDGFFNVEASSYGRSGPTIIFQPTVKTIYPVRNEEVFQVEVKGIQDKAGKATVLRYHTIIYDN